MNKPKKLIRDGILKFLKEDEWEVIEDSKELNKLFALKVQEELLEIQEANHKDITEFGDLLQVVYDFALANGFTQEEIAKTIEDKRIAKGTFTSKFALTNMNPENVSNQIYFKQMGTTSL